MYLAAVAFTTVIASLATGAFAIFYFNRLALVETVANMVAVPVATMWVMPLAAVTLPGPGQVGLLLIVARDCG